MELENEKNVMALYMVDQMSASACLFLFYLSGNAEVIAYIFECEWEWPFHTKYVICQSAICQIAENASWHRALQGSINLSPPVNSTVSRHLSLVILAINTQSLCDITFACWSATPQAVLLLR